MTTVTLTDRRIDQQHSGAAVAGQSAGIVATCPGALEVEDCIGLGGIFLKMWVLERLDVAEICIVVFVWARFLL